MWNSTPLKFHNYFSSPILCMKTQEIMWLVLSAPHWISKNLCGNQNNIKFVLLGPSRWDVVLSPWYGKRRLWHSLCNRGYRNISMLWVFGFVWFFCLWVCFFFYRLSETFKVFTVNDTCCMLRHNIPIRASPMETKGNILSSYYAQQFWSLKVNLELRILLILLNLKRNTGLKMECKLKSIKVAIHFWTSFDFMILK